VQQRVAILDWEARLLRLAAVHRHSHGGTNLEAQTVGEALPPFAGQYLDDGSRRSFDDCVAQVFAGTAQVQ